MQSTLKLSLLAATIFLLHLSANAQQLMISAGASVGSSIGTRSDALQTAGAMIGAEVKIKKFSLGIDLDWQQFKGQIAVTELFMLNGGAPPVGYMIERQQTNTRIVLRYYLSETLKGGYIGVFGAGGLQAVTTSGYPDNNSYIQAYSDPRDYDIFGAGFTYGYRLRIAPKWRLSLSGSHQWGRDDSPEYKQKNHQFIAGLGYAF